MLGQGYGAMEYVKRYLMKLPRSIEFYYIFKGQTKFCLSCPPLGAEQLHLGDRWPLFGHPYPLMNAFEPDQAWGGKPLLSSPMKWYRVPVKSVKCEQGGGLLTWHVCLGTKKDAGNVCCRGRRGC